MDLFKYLFLINEFSMYYVGDVGLVESITIIGFLKGIHNISHFYGDYFEFEIEYHLRTFIYNELENALNFGLITVRKHLI